METHYATLPFPVIVEHLQRCLLAFWQGVDACATVIGSMALRAHMSPDVRLALASGVTDLDLWVCTEAA